MAMRLKEVDAVMVGMGWTGSIMARELTKAGLTVIGLERGEDLSPRENFTLPAVPEGHNWLALIEPERLLAVIAYGTAVIFCRGTRLE